jgi:thymidylate synthase
MKFEKDYKNLITEVLNFGEGYDTRSGKTRALFGTQLKIEELRYGFFPLITSRKMYPGGVFGELAAFVRGPKHVDDFSSRGCNYWGAWAKPDGSIKVDYGNKWLDFHGTNQVKELIEGLKTNPFGRRHIINSWDASSLPTLDLPCCHYCYQFQVDRQGCLNMVWIQRSVDLMVGLPSDIVLAATMVLLIAQQVNLKPGTITMQFGDTHVYSKHIEDAVKYVKRKSLKLPYWMINKKATLTSFMPSDINIRSYVSHAPIKFELMI